MKVSPLFRLVLLLLAFVACKSDRLAPVTGELRPGTTRLPFPDAIVGQTTHANLTLSNTGRADMDVTLATVEPFSGSRLALTIPGGSSTVLSLAFAPPALGPYEQPLTLTANGVTQQVLLIGECISDPKCLSANACKSSTLERVSARCVEAPLPDGTNCTQSTACFSAASCVAGECVGTPISCDDHDACSTDVCEPSSGCVHFPATARCASSTDPCKVPACDPVVGCTFTDAEDGTRCGPSDCSTARVCITGTCQTRPVSEGAPCGDRSPCQARGRCTEGTCVRPPPGQLTTAWTVWAKWGERVDAPAMADEQNNVYWRERNEQQGTASVVSVSSAGDRRFDVPVGPVVRAAIIDGVLVVQQPSSLQGRKLTDGSLTWARELNDGNVVTSVKSISRGLGGSMYVGYTRFDAGFAFGSMVGATVAALNVYDGTTLWQSHLPNQSVDDQSMPVDERGFVYVGTWEERSPLRRYVSFTPSGATRWSFPNPHGGPAAVFGGRVYHWDHWLSETSDGGWVNEEAPTLLASGYPRLALGAISFVGSDVIDAGSCSSPDTVVPSRQMHLVRVDPPTSTQRWSVRISGPGGAGEQLTNPVLTSNATVVFSQPLSYCDPNGAYVLREVSAFGESSYSCPLPGTETYYGEGLLVDGKWIAAIRSRDGGQDGMRAIELPGVMLPEHGWSVAWGSSARDNHAR